MKKFLGLRYLEFGAVLYMVLGMPWYLAIITWAATLVLFLVFSPLDIPQIPEELKKSKELDPNGKEYLSRYMPKN